MIPGTSCKVLTCACCSSSMDLKYFIKALRRLGPTPLISSSTECTCALLRSDLWYVIAKRWASSWIRVISLKPSEFLSMGSSLFWKYNPLVRWLSSFTIPHTGIFIPSSSNTCKAIFTCPRPPSMSKRSGNFVKLPKFSSMFCSCISCFSSSPCWNRLVNTSCMQA